MIEKLLEVANRWSSTQPSAVEIQPLKTEEGQLVEITWKRDGGDTAYIDLFPHSDGFVIVQHGMYATKDRRYPCGVTRVSLPEVARNLDRLKESIAAVVMPRWTYQPTVEIGVVSSLKFH